jgi:hypothetical protein
MSIVTLPAPGYRVRGVVIAHLWLARLAAVGLTELH